jgi:hypothetical protein
VGGGGVSANCAHGAQTNFGDLTPFLTYGGRVEMGGGVFLPLSWSVHNNFVRDGRYSERGGGCASLHPQQAGLIFPS